MVEKATFSKHDIPLCPTTAKKIPEKLIGYDEAKTIHNKMVRNKKLNYHINAFIHFYIDDSKFDGKRTKRVLIKIAKNALLNGSVSDYILKFDMHSSMNYKDLMNMVWATKEGSPYWQTKQEGYITEAAENALSKNGNIGERFKYYITRIKNLIGNNPTDFTKPNHILNENINRFYTGAEKTNEGVF